MDLDLIKSGGPTLVAIVLLAKMYFDNRRTMDRDSVANTAVDRFDSRLIQLDQRQIAASETLKSVSKAMESVVARLAELHVQMSLQTQSMEAVKRGFERIIEDIAATKRGEV